ncbi:MAG TPA: TerC family protein [Spirochaetes bacterium]|nr:TerC family protein [Spirochaetota bacterium]
MLQYVLWAGFVLFILGLLVLDLKVFQRKEHEISVREALLWTGFWIALSLVFNAGVYYFEGAQPALEFLTGYLIEKSLSVDNIFVFLLIFTYFGIKPKYQHKVLFWGILGALVMRAVFILTGIALIQKLHWIIYVFGAFLVFIGIRMAFEKEKEVHPEKNPVLRLFKRFFPVTDTYEEGTFFVRRAGKLVATPLFVVVLVIETTDVVFAVDSIPAILSITLDPFIVYTSNVFAILGLRALYFAIAGIMAIFYYLHYGLSAILVFVGVKMLIADFYKIHTGVALGVVGGVLLLSILASLVFPHAPRKMTGTGV